MTQEEKQLLLIDLCGRLPYCNTRIESPNEELYKWLLLDIPDIQQLIYPEYGAVILRPYLRPLSSMTEEETKQYESICDLYINGQGVKHYFNNIATIDWYNRKHFDYRGLIDKGLALPAPEGMYEH